MVLRKSILILLLWLPGMAWAQNEWWSEMWVEETGDEEAVAEMSDLMQQLQAQPVNINDTQAVAELPFISPFQRKALRNYILLHGQLEQSRPQAFARGCFLCPDSTVLR